MRSRTTTCSVKRGQMALIAMLAFVLVVFTVIMGIMRNRAIERQTESDRNRLDDERTKDLQLSRIVDESLRESVHAAAKEVGSHGGYRAENVPPLVLSGIPYWFHDGVILQVPSHDAVEAAVRTEAQVRLRQELEQIESLPEHERLGLKLNMASFSLSMSESNIVSEAKIEMEYSPGDTIKRTTLAPAVTAHLRLEHLRERMAAVFTYLIENRTVRDRLFDVMGDDMRIPNPKGSEPAECGNVTIPGSSIGDAMGEDASLVAIQVLSQIRRNGTLTEAELQWRMAPVMSELEFALRDRFGYTNKVVKESIPFILGTCQRSWRVNYNLTLPIVISAVDLRRSARVVGGDDVSVVSPLSFNAVFQARIVENQAIERQTGSTSTGDGCDGKCSLTITVEDDNPDDGLPLLESVAVEGCDLDLGTNSQLDGQAFAGVPCGDVALTIRPRPGTDRFGIDTRQRLTEGEDAELKLVLRSSASLNGTVVRQGRVLCVTGSEESCLGNTHETGTNLLGFVAGVPPRYVEIVLASLEFRDLIFVTRADEQGKYSFPNVRSGTYVIAGIPSRDNSGNPGFKVLPSMEHIVLSPGENEHTIVLQPFSPVRDKEGWTTIDTVEACDTC